MILTKRTILKLMENNPPLIEDIVDANIQIQNNGVDMTIGSIYRQFRRGVIDFDNSKRFIAPREIITPMRDDYMSNTSENPYYALKPGAYSIILKQKMNLPKNIVAIVKPRSSLIRNSAYIESGAWDAGYSGNGLVLLYVASQYGIKLYENARICQMLFIATDEDTSGYQGIYQGETTQKME